MKKIILAATGEELEWRDDVDGDPCLVRKADEGVPRRSLPFTRIVAAAYGARHGSRVGWAYLLEDSDDGYDGGRWESVEDIEMALVGRGFIRIEGEESQSQPQPQTPSELEPQPGPTTEEYLISEARAIILDAARNNFDHKRALRFIADSEGM